MVVEQFGYHKQRKGTRINGYLGHELVLVKRDISFFFYITFVALFVALCGIFRGTETNSPASPPGAAAAAAAPAEADPLAS